MIDEHYGNPRLARLYNLDSGWSAERDFYVRFAGPSSNSVLDVACGTGLIACRLAQEGHSVVAVDPASAMLEVARRSPGGELVDWIASTAQDFDARRNFDRVMITGNAFQVLLTERDLQATLRNLRRHLTAAGLIAFETRNPEIDWSSIWNYGIELQTPAETVLERRRLLSRAGNLLHFELVYEFPDEVLKSESTLRLWHQEEIRHHLGAAGLRVKDTSGDWNGGPLDRQRSEEMIFLVESIQREKG